jgi:hypothetical protein
MKWLAPLGCFVCLLVDLAERWYYSRDIDRFEGDSMPARWIAWGNVLKWRSKEPMHRYFFVRLPSWDYILDPHRVPTLHGQHFYRWAQRSVYFMGPYSPHTTRGRWWMTWVDA